MKISRPSPKQKDLKLDDFYTARDGKMTPLQWTTFKPPFTSFLFSLDDIFERFIRNTLQAGFRPKSISVTDGNFTRHQVPLFEDNKKFPIKPDVIFKSNRSVIGMAEVKYKPKLKEVDRYQVISHVVGLKSPLGIWISPRNEGQPELEYIGKISSDAKFYHYRFDLHSDIKKSQESMISRISDLLN